ncbi:MAG: FABP family protein [Corynebacterium sp.]|nr:FABP family protein [Corynebacterium sp.]
MSENEPQVENQNENTAPAPKLDANEAVAAAAERAKNTAHRNIPQWEDLPVEGDTANLRLGPNIHDGLLALLPLVGVWRGEGEADSPEHGQHAFGQQLTFSHNGQNYLSYESLIWRLDDKGEKVGDVEREVGFWRISLKDEIEVTATSSRGLVEILYGEPLNERAWQLESASTMVTATGPAGFGPGKRLYGLMPNGMLGWVDERHVNGELKPYMSAQLQRVVG